VVTDLIKHGYRNIDYLPGSLALQALYPAVDVMGVDRLRKPILSNGLFVDEKFSHKPQIVEDLEAAEGEKPEVFYRSIKVLPGGKGAIETALAYYKYAYSSFSMRDDTEGLDSVGAAIGVMSHHVSERLKDPEFMALARLSLFEAKRGYFHS